MNPLQCVDHCPICGDGLCGIRICGIDTNRPHGLLVCDECEAIWLQPDTSSEHRYGDPSSPRCPICEMPLWGEQSRWASLQDCRSLGWQEAIDPNLHCPG